VILFPVLVAEDELELLEEDDELDEELDPPPHPPQPPPQQAYAH
jgi:hypothetical protein